MSFGRYYEEFVVGDTYSHRPSVKVTTAMNRNFCAITHNPHPLHTNLAYAARTQYGQLVVPGTLTLSLVVGMSVPEVSGKAIASLVFHYVTHEAPVFIGDTISAASYVKEKRLSKSRPGVGIVRIASIGTKHEHFKSGGRVTTVILFERSILVPCREDIS